MLQNRSADLIMFLTFFINQKYRLNSFQQLHPNMEILPRLGSAGGTICTLADFCQIIFNVYFGQSETERNYVS